MTKSTLTTWIKGLKLSPTFEPMPEPKSTPIPQGDLKTLTTPKCKTCYWLLHSGRKSFCNHPKAPESAKKCATRIPSVNTRTSPEWCSMRIV